MADEKISELPALTGAIADLDVLPVVDASASETKKISAKHLIQSAFAIVDDDSIPLVKVDTSGLTVEIPDGAVTAAKLADNSSGIYDNLPATGVFQGQVAVDAATKISYMWSGSAWTKTAGATAVAATGISPIQATGGLASDGTLSVSVGVEPTTGARQFLAGPTGTAGNVESRQIIGADLPIATGGSLGAVSPGSGLTVSGAGSLSIDNSISASTVPHLVTYDAHGLILTGQTIGASDLPIATDTNPGVVSAGRGLSVGVDGALNIANQITATTGSKFRIDGQGSIVDVLVQTAADIPDLPASKITTGDLSPSLTADRSIEEIKLADYSTCYVQEGQPSNNPKQGQFWFTPSTSQLRVYARGSGSDLWLSVGFGALQASNLRWAGTFNAATGTIIALTDIGVSEGLTAGGPVPAATDELSGIYFVCEEAGNNVNLLDVTGDTFTAGDWLLCINEAQGYTALNISAGGGGGSGGATTLNGLTDVDIQVVEAEQFLQYNAVSGTWKNVSDINGGTF